MSERPAIELWWATIDDVGQERMGALLEELDAPTRAQVRTLAMAEDRARSVTAHALARRLVGARTGRDPRRLRLERRCAACGQSDHGRPSFAGDDMPDISISHAGPLVVVAIAAPGAAAAQTPDGLRAPSGAIGSIGVDVELPRPGSSWDQVRRHTFTDEEWERTAVAADPDAARLLLWSAKEAASKATGHGLELGLQRVATTELPRPGGRWVTATITAEALAGQGVALAALPAPLRGAALAVAALGDPPAALPELHDATQLLSTP